MTVRNENSTGQPAIILNPCRQPTFLQFPPDPKTKTPVFVRRYEPAWILRYSLATAWAGQHNERPQPGYVPYLHHGRENENSNTSSFLATFLAKVTWSTGGSVITGENHRKGDYPFSILDVRRYA